MLKKIVPVLELVVDIKLLNSLFLPNSHVARNRRSQTHSQVVAGVEEIRTQCSLVMNNNDYCDICALLVTARINQQFSGNYKQAMALIFAMQLRDI